MTPPVSVEQPEPTTSAAKNDYWVKQGDAPITEMSVSPDATSMGYERWSRHKLQQWTRHHVAKRARFDHVVDLGCGFGDFTAAIAVGAKRVTVCDMVPAFVEEAQRRVRAVGVPDVVGHVSDVVSFDNFADASVVYLGGVLTYLTRDESLRVIRRVRERLAPGGIVAQRDWCVFGLGKEKVLQTKDKYSEHRKLGTYVEMFEEAGFRCLERKASPYMYGEQMTRQALRADLAVTALGWLPQALWRLSTLHWYDCSASFIYEAK